MLRRPSYRTSWALAACLATAALILSVEAAAARSGGAVNAGAARGAPAHVAGHVHGARTFRHHRGFVNGGFWLGDDAYAYGPYDGAPAAEAPPAQGPADVHYTYTEDVPWDWAHRYPPNVTPSDHPYVSSCPTETVTVPGRGGEQTINITRCY